ncbi:MAG TPA: polysaccharide deacetylase family protein [Kofleriaceae bacterium]|nr:polysaccharide deacetylase family protein [Kofleriaceae bacterium]
MTGLGARLQRGAAELLPSSLVVFHGPREARRIALTFDDGPEQLLGEYLDALERFSARATFFVLGECLAVRREGVYEMIRRGHEVASHGYSHKRFTLMTRGELDDELDRTDALLPVSRAPRPLLRPPQGATNLRSLVRCARRGYTTVLWSLDSDDCRTEDPRVVAERCAPERVTPGEIVLLHEGQRWTLEALPQLLAGLSGAGYALVTVGELLAGAGNGG